MNSNPFPATQRVGSHFFATFGTTLGNRDKMAQVGNRGILAASCYWDPSPRSMTEGCCLESRIRLTFQTHISTDLSNPFLGTMAWILPPSLIPRGPTTASRKGRFAAPFLKHFFRRLRCARPCSPRSRWCFAYFYFFTGGRSGQNSHPGDEGDHH